MSVCRKLEELLDLPVHDQSLEIIAVLAVAYDRARDSGDRRTLETLSNLGQTLELERRLAHLDLSF